MHLECQTKGLGTHCQASGSQSRCYGTQRVQEGASELLQGVKGCEEETQGWTQGPWPHSSQNDSNFTIFVDCAWGAVRGIPQGQVGGPHWALGSECWLPERKN